MAPSDLRNTSTLKIRISGRSGDNYGILVSGKLNLYLAKSERKIKLTAIVINEGSIFGAMYLKSNDCWPLDLMAHTDKAVMYFIELDKTKKVKVRSRIQEWDQDDDDILTLDEFSSFIDIEELLKISHVSLPTDAQLHKQFRQIETQWRAEKDIIHDAAVSNIKINPSGGEAIIKVSSRLQPWIGHDVSRVYLIIHITCKINF